RRHPTHWDAVPRKLRASSRSRAGGSTSMTTTARRPHASLDEITARVLNELQDYYPLVERPCREVGERLGLTEEETIARLREAREAGVVRQVCAIFDTKA